MGAAAMDNIKYVIWWEMGDTSHLKYSSLSLTVGVAFVRNAAIGKNKASWEIRV